MNQKIMTIADLKRLLDELAKELGDDFQYGFQVMKKEMSFCQCSKILNSVWL